MGHSGVLQVMEEVRHLLSSQDEDPDRSIRVDQRHLPFLAIDDAATKEVRMLSPWSPFHSQGKSWRVVSRSPQFRLDFDRACFCR